MNSESGRDVSGRETPMEHRARRVGINSIILTTSTAATKVLTFAYVFVVMRYLGPEVYGKYALA